MWELEYAAMEQGYTGICGCDEAGAGPLAGPVYAAAVILPFGLEIPGLTDSKKLTEKKREALFPIIKEKAVAWAVASVDEKEIDATDILSARMKAMQLAIDALGGKADFALIDGNRAKDFGMAVRTGVKGDSLSANIAAASVLAKVTRDDLMVEMAQEFPGYGFEVHKGYGTKAHYEALREKGPCAIHRMTFLKKFYGEK